MFADVISITERALTVSMLRESRRLFSLSHFTLFQREPQRDRDERYDG
jgi:hypothetical protein